MNVDDSRRIDMTGWGILRAEMASRISAGLLASCDGALDSKHRIWLASEAVSFTDALLEQLKASESR